MANDSFLLIRMINSYVCVCMRTRACSHAYILLVIQKKSPTSDKITQCLYHYVVLKNGPTFNPLRHSGYNSCPTCIKIKQHCILLIQSIYMFHMTLYKQQLFPYTAPLFLHVSLFVVHLSIVLS